MNCREKPKYGSVGIGLQNLNAQFTEQTVAKKRKMDISQNRVENKL